MLQHLWSAAVVRGALRVNVISSEHFDLQGFGCWEILHVFCCLLIFSIKNSFKNTTRVSNNVEADQAQTFVRPDLGTSCLQRYLEPNCFQMFLAEDTSRRKVIIDTIQAVNNKSDDQTAGIQQKRLNFHCWFIFIAEFLYNIYILFIFTSFIT